MGEVLWAPPANWREISEIGRFMSWLRNHRDEDFDSYEDLHRWSVSDLEGFWGAVAEFFELSFVTLYERVLEERVMPGARWFPGATLNFAEHMVGDDQVLDQVAVIGHSQTRERVVLTFGELREQVARVRAGLQALGVRKGDRVVAYMPSIPETLVAYLATASLGAIWASCAIEFGPRSVIDRFGQLDPKVLITVPGYGYRDRYIDRGAEVETTRDGLPSLEHTIVVPYGCDALPAGSISWDQLTREDGPLEFDSVPFDHPVYVLFSSGTTGLPKAIVHSHGGQLIEHHKNLGFSWDLKLGERMMWFATTAWMLWNASMSALLKRASVVMLDGDPTWPDLMEQWRLAQELDVTVMGASGVYLMACRKAGLRPGRGLGLERLRVLATAGSPFPADGYRWIYENFGSSVLFINGTGGTDLCSGMIGGSFAQPVYEGELTAPYLGLDIHAFDTKGSDVAVGEVGEMVITAPAPSMPVGFWGDEHNRRYRDTYFDLYPGVWRQGDWVRFTARGSCVVEGRSDSTLNRGGVRLGTGEFYAVIEGFPEIADSLVVHLEDDSGGAGRLLLFVVTVAGQSLDDELSQRLKEALRSQLSPRHAPDEIAEVRAIPRTLTGKKLEAPVKRILKGEPPDSVASRGALLDPTALDQFTSWRAQSTVASVEDSAPRSGGCG